MTTTATDPIRPRARAARRAVRGPGLVGEAPPSPAGPIDADALAALPAPPTIDAAAPGPDPALQPAPDRVHVRRAAPRSARSSGCAASIPGGPVVTSHPDHVRSLFTAKPEQAPSLTGESPLRPIVGPNSVLTAVGRRHMRQRKLLLPPFHGEAIEAYTRMIAEAAEREIDRWPIGEPFALAPRMQAITLDVIMAGIFGIEGTARRRARPSTALRQTVKQPGRRLDPAERPADRAPPRRPRRGRRAR